MYIYTFILTMHPILYDPSSIRSSLYEKRWRTAIRRERQPESTDETNPVRWGLKCYKTEVCNNGCTHSCRSVAKEVEVVVFTEEIRFWLRRLELLATHDEVTAEVATCQKNGNIC